MKIKEEIKEYVCQFKKIGFLKKLAFIWVCLFATVIAGITVGLGIMLYIKIITDSPGVLSILLETIIILPMILFVTVCPSIWLFTLPGDVLWDN